jgi:hypothetical protein
VTHVRGTLDTQVIPGARGQAHTALEAGHYIQDDMGETVARLLLDFMALNPIAK